MEHDHDASVEERLNLLERDELRENRKLDEILEREEAMQIDTSRVVAATEHIDNVEAGMLVAFQTLADEVRNGGGPAQTPEVQAALDAAASTLEADAAKMTAAILAGTPVPFVQKIAGETFKEHEARLFEYNQGKPDALQAPAPSLDAWNALDPVTDEQPAPVDPSGQSATAQLHVDNAFTPESPQGSFVDKLPNETYHDYVARATAAGFSQVIPEQEWNGIVLPPLNGDPNAAGAAPTA